MRTSIKLAPICVTVLLLAGCGKSFNGAPPPQVAPITASTDTAQSTAAGVSVSPGPAASSVDPSRPMAEAGRSNATMTRNQESNGMPMAGQNNDHSAPVAPDKSASAPR
jgi:hypothetical protein